LEFSKQAGAAFDAQQAPGLDGAEIDLRIHAGRFACAQAARPALGDAECLRGAEQAELKSEVGNPPFDNLTADASRGIGTLCRSH
jgi:hypothetical protein